MSLRLRVALLTAAAVAIVEIAIVVAIYTATTERLYAQAEQELRSAASVIVPVVTATGSLPLRPSQDPERPPNVPRLISAEGQVVANNNTFGTPTDTQLLSFRDWLKATQGFGGEDPVIIRPNSQTSHERIIQVLNACAAAGIKNLTFS